MWKDHERAWGGRIILIAVVCAVGCTKVLYKGPSRPESEIAVLMSTNTSIGKVDGVVVHDDFSGTSARLEVLPGRHLVGVRLEKSTPGFLMTTFQFSGDVVLCLDLLGGHSYRTDARIDGKRWIPAVMDETLGRPIDVDCGRARAARLAEGARLAAGSRSATTPTIPPTTGNHEVTGSPTARTSVPDAAANAGSKVDK